MNNKRIPYLGSLEEGIILINKPKGWKSFDVVRFLRALLKNLTGKPIKVGHAGTLDPLAEGLLVLASGTYTKRLYQYLGEDKSYITTITLGESTPSHDRETPVNKTLPLPNLDKQILFSTLEQFKGKLSQRPPDFSAVKIKGKRAYSLAREGKLLDLESKMVEIKKIELLKVDLPRMTFQVTCSKGTYIRSLVRDIGDSLQCGAVMEHLLRTHCGPLSLNDAVTPVELKKYFSNVAIEFRD